ncbi:UNVERIFIED_CONTAM: hypothetical protein GTU68_043062 [Idotea baltica]|nr:hypothetical protein [Idotea baltica]
MHCERAQPTRSTTWRRSPRSTPVFSSQSSRRRSTLWASRDCSTPFALLHQQHASIKHLPARSLVRHGRRPKPSRLRCIPAARTASPRSTDTGSPRTTARATACMLLRESSSITKARAAAPNS